MASLSTPNGFPDELPKKPEKGGLFADPWEEEKVKQETANDFEFTLLWARMRTDCLAPLKILFGLLTEEEYRCFLEEVQQKKPGVTEQEWGCLALEEIRRRVLAQREQEKNG